MPDQTKETKAVEILKRHFDEIEQIVAQSDQFATVSDYVNFVLEEILHGEEQDDYSDEDEAVVKQRLRDLGYL